MQLVRLRLSAAAVLALAVAIATPSAARAQDATKVVTPSFDFSGVLFANWQSHSDSASQATLGGKSPNQFQIERVYLNFRMPAGERASIRVTTDVFQQTNTANNAFYGGWVVRLKYAYAQLNALNNIGGSDGFNAVVRLGMLHTVLIDHVEGFWPRYLGTTGTDRNSFFSSSDVGAAVLVSLPNKMGEVYGTLTNGSGYQAFDTDRFKDLALRVSLTPLMNAPVGVFKTVTISPWYYDGEAGSKFAAGGAGQVGPVTDGLTKSRYGVFLGNKDRRLILGLDWAARTDQTEGGANTTASPRTTTDVDGNLLSTFAVVRPGAFMDEKGPMSRWGLIGRLDTFTPNKDAKVNGDTPANQYTVFGAFWDFTSRITMSLDMQQQTRKNGSVTPETKVLFAHLQATF